MARSGVQSWSLSPVQLGMQSSSGAERLKLYCPLDTLHFVSLYLPLIGFNERFNNTALPDQIKLLLSSALNPGSLLCNARMSQDTPFCKAPTTSLLAPSSHILSLLPCPLVCLTYCSRCLIESRLRNLMSKNCTNKVLTRQVVCGEGCLWVFVVELRVRSHLQVKRNLIVSILTSTQEVGVMCDLFRNFFFCLLSFSPAEIASNKVWLYSMEDFSVLSFVYTGWHCSDQTSLS